MEVLTAVKYLMNTFSCHKDKNRQQEKTDMYKSFVIKTAYELA